MRVGASVVRQLRASRSQAVADFLSTPASRASCRSAISPGSALSTLSVASANNLGTTRLAGASIHTTGQQSYGQDVALVTQESLRHAIALVPQDVALLHRSLRENISYGRPGTTAIMGGLDMDDALRTRMVTEVDRDYRERLGI